MGRGKIFINGHIVLFFLGFFSFSFFFCYYQKNDNFSTSNNGFARNTSNFKFERKYHKFILTQNITYLKYFKSINIQDTNDFFPVCSFWGLQIRKKNQANLNKLKTYLIWMIPASSISSFW